MESKELYHSPKCREVVILTESTILSGQGGGGDDGGMEEGGEV